MQEKKELDKTEYEGFREWYRNEILRSPLKKVNGARLFARYAGYCQRHGIKALQMHDFFAALEEKGHEKLVYFKPFQLSKNVVKQVGDVVFSGLQIKEKPRI